MRVDGPRLKGPSFGVPGRGPSVEGWGSGVGHEGARLMASGMRGERKRDGDDE